MSEKIETNDNMVSLQIFWNVFKKHWLFLLIVTLITVIGVGTIYRYVFYRPVYSSGSKYYVSNVSETTSLYSGTQTSAANDMARYCAEFMDGNVVLEDVLKQAELTDEERATLSVRRLRSMISTRSSDTALFSVTVSGPDNEINYKISCAIEKVLPKHCDAFNNQKGSDGTGEETSKLLKITNHSQLDTTADNVSRLYQYPLFAGAAVFAVCYFIFVFCCVITRTIYTADDVREKLDGGSLFGEIPHWEIGKESGKKRHGFAVSRRKNMELRVNVEEKRIDLGNVPFGISESFRQLCTNVSFCSDGKTGCTVGVLSCCASSGKSFIMANLALSLSELIGKKVLLVDADMRCPMQHRIFRLDNKVGLSNLIAGQVDEATAVRTVKEGTLDLITSGTIPPNATVLLSSTAMSELLERWKREYDYILLDLPPVGAVSDAMTLARRISGFLFVLRSGLDDCKAILECVGQMKEKDATIFGYVLTDVAQNDMKYGYYSKYGKYSGYAPGERAATTEK